MTMYLGYPSSEKPGVGSSILPLATEMGPPVTDLWATVSCPHGFAKGSLSHIPLADSTSTNR